MKKLDVVFENQDIIVAHKPSGVVVNRSDTLREETLQDIISKYLKLSKGDLGIGERAGIVHRLDRETSGLVVIAKTQQVFLNLQLQFKNRQVEKKYIALVHGQMLTSGVISENIGRVGKFGKFGVVDIGRESETSYKKEGEYCFREDKFGDVVGHLQLTRGRIRYLRQNAKFYSLIFLMPKTGRTHQIRVHLKHIGHPVVSDIIYCPNKLLKFDQLWCNRLFLHASTISFREPESGKMLSFKSELPHDLVSALRYLTIMT